MIFCTQWDARTQIVSIWHEQTLWRRLLRMNPKEEHYRLEDGNWYDAHTFKPVLPKVWLKCHAIKCGLEAQMKSI